MADEQQAAPVVAAPAPLDAQHRYALVHVLYDLAQGTGKLVSEEVSSILLALASAVRSGDPAAVGELAAAAKAALEKRGIAVQAARPGEGPAPVVTRSPSLMEVAHRLGDRAVWSDLWRQMTAPESRRAWLTLALAVVIVVVASVGHCSP